ncbi:S-adenosyl-L-methionine-dependent methyltransferase [Cylindrobasidium torrendii FP15055 ss-10]|uniref:S-adenosyl-L-methionine-dependent methyltransferase n=1 Tax=Cylindrobasidium torrendii FP15055 ss-10 TaxID=1314674 RepID=A0A0D7BLI5_9AGAR|nr:S-adenosyl-L-methionine-dependent methyltransferase [Cylindrobasidium torrendii FP15055 ss-10]
MSTSPTSSPLGALVNILDQNVTALEDAYAKAGAESVPSLDDLYSPSPLDKDPVIAGYRKSIIAASDHLSNSVGLPFENTQTAVGGLYALLVIGIVEDANIPDILLEAGVQGMHAKDIAAICGLDASIIARCLRYLATRHIFREISPDVFTNNRNSSIFVKGQPVQELKANPEGRYSTPSFAATIRMMNDEMLVGACAMNDWVKSPGSADSAFSLGHKTDKNIWEWYALPGNELRARRFANHMRNVTAQFPNEIIVKAIDGASMKEDEVVVDMGGGVGHAVLVLSKAYPHLKFVLQDLPNQKDPALSFWNANAPDTLSSGKVTFQEHNFFEAQPVEGAAVYFMRACLHDWPDVKAQRIMQRVCDAATPGYSKLVVMEGIMRHVCEDPAIPSDAPWPLLRNYGVAGSGFQTLADFQVLNICNGKERTVQDFRELGASAGWKLEEVRQGAMMAYIFVPA